MCFHGPVIILCIVGISTVPVILRAKTERAFNFVGDAFIAIAGINRIESDKGRYF